MRYFGMTVSSQFWGGGESPTSESCAQGPRPAGGSSATIDDQAELEKEGEQAGSALTAMRATLTVALSLPEEGRHEPNPGGPSIRAKA